MLIPIAALADRLRLRPVAVLHVGAHAAEELSGYRQHDWAPRVWVEALPDLAAELRQRLVGSDEDLVVEGAVWSSSGLALPMHRASNGESSSLLEPMEHLTVHPEVRFGSAQTVVTVTLDDVMEAAETRFGIRPDLINLDIQGAEVAALSGLTRWDGIRWVYSEVAVRELYAGQPLVGEMDRLLDQRGFRRVGTVLLPHLGWGDALWVHRDVWRDTPSLARLRFLAEVAAMRSRIRASLVLAALRRRLSRA